MKPFEPMYEHFSLPALCKLDITLVVRVSANLIFSNAVHGSLPVEFTEKTIKSDDSRDRWTAKSVAVAFFLLLQ